MGINVMIERVKDQVLEYLKINSPSDFERLSTPNPKPKKQLEQHKNHIIQKIKEFGTYNDLQISAIKEAEIRQQILKKYFWVLSFHNSACKAYDFPECSINCSTSLDIRFMRMNVEISDDNL